MADAASWREERVEHLHLLRGGRDRGTPLLLLHGLADAAICWAPVAGPLGGSHLLVAPDARGHGRSELPADATMDNAARVADAVAVLAELDRPAAIVGHSMGADTAARVAAEYPDIVEAVVLEDPPWRPPERAGERGEHRQWIADLQAMGHTERVERGAEENPGWSLDELVPWAVAKAQVDPAVFPVEWDDGPTWEEVVADLRCPALLLTGERERDAIVAPEQAERFRALAPQGEVVHIAAAGHCIRRDQRRAYLDAVLAFLPT